MGCLSYAVVMVSVGLVLVDDEEHAVTVIEKVDGMFKCSRL